MAIILITVLALCCAVLALRLFALNRDMRSAREQLRQREARASTALIQLTTPHSAMESLLQEINALLELREDERAEYRRREETLRRQIANVSHDLRTPLTSILGYLQLLEGEGLTQEERREYLAVVQGRAKTLQTLIGAFYDLSRLEGGEYPLQRQSVALHPLLSELIAEFYGDFESSGLEVTVELDEGLAPVSADPNGALRILTNLLGNALKHGRTFLRVRMYAQEGRVVTAFSNGAPDLAQDDLGHIFDRFYTGDQMRTGRNTGLGLAIVKTLVEQMGHTVRAELAHGVFTVSVVWTTAQGV